MTGEITPLYLVLAGLAGLLIGLLVAGLFNRGEKNAPKESTLPEELKKEGFTEVARLWYTPNEKRIMPEIDGEFYKEFSAFSEEQQKRVQKMAELYSAWAKKPTQVDEQKFSLPSTIEVPQKPFIEPENQSEPARQPAGFQIRPIPKDTIDQFNTPEPVEFTEIVKAIRPATIAGQVSEIVDEMIKTTPLREKGIKLIERPDHGVDVWIGMEKFNGIEAIPYPDVKKLIKAAVTRWEQETLLKKKLSGIP
jgi:hypothetical protein